MNEDLKYTLGLDGVSQFQAGANRAARSLTGIGEAGKLTGRDLTQVSAQLQDFFIQLQAGQSPITALLQQGSQLATVFGGVGNAMAAVRAAITPATLGIAAFGGAVAAIAVGYKQLVDETGNYNRALVLSGNIAGTTTSQLQALAKAQASVAGTQGRAAEFLTQLASSGKVSASLFAETLAAATKLERAGGPALDETAKKFIELGRAPLQAILKLNDAENFLTAKTHEQVRALVVQRKEQEAATLAIQTYADTVAQRGDALEKKLGSLQRGWRAVGEGAKAAWDAMLDIGRPETTENKLQRAQKELQTQEERLARLVAQALQQRQRFAGFTGAQPIDPALVTGPGIAEARAAVAAAAWNVREAGAEKAAEAAVAGAAEAQKKVNKDIAETDLRLQLQAANVQAAYETMSARVAGEVDHIQSKLRQGLIGELEVLEETSAKRIDLLRARLAVLRAELGVAQRTVGGDVQARRIEGQIGGLKREITAAEQKAENDVLELRYRQRMVQEKAYADLLEQTAQEQGAADKARGDALRDQANSLQQQREALEDNARLIAAEGDLAAVSGAKRGLSLALLQEQIRLERQLQQIKESGIDRRIVYDKNGEFAGVEDTGFFAGQAVRNSRIAQENIRREQYVQEWTRTYDRVGTALVDAITGAGEKAAKQLQDLFKELVLQPIIKPFIEPFAKLLTTAVTEATVGGGIGSPQSISSLLGLGQALSAGFTGGFANIGKQASSLYSSIFGSSVNNASTIAARAGETGYYGVSAASQSAATASTVGQIAAQAAGIAAGILAGRGLSGGYSALGGGSGSTAVNLGTAIGAYFGGPVGSALGGAIGGLVNRAFGRKAPEITSRTIEGSFTGTNFTGSAYANILERGGLFRSDKKYQEAIDTTDLDKALDQGAKDLSTLAKRYGEALGLPVSRLSEVTTQLKIELEKVDTPEQLQAALEKGISGALKQYADALLGSFAPEIEPFRKAGETVAEALERMGSALLDVNKILGDIGITSLAASVSGAQTASTLTELFNGIDNFATAAQGYYERFFSDEEKLQRARSQFGAVFAEIGQGVPQTRAEFRKLVEAQDLTTEGGQKIFAALLSVAEAFDLVTTAADELADKAAKAAAGLNDAIGKNISGFLSPEKFREYRYRVVANDLSRSGIDVSADTLAGLSKDQIYEFVAGFLQLGDVSNETKIAVVEAAGALAGLKDEAATAAQQLIDDAARLAKEQAARERGVVGGADRVIGDFLSGQQLASYYASRVGDLLREGGIDSTVPGILGSTREDILNLWNAVGTKGREAILNAYDAWTKLQDVLYGTAKAVDAYRQTTLADRIEEARLASLSPTARIARLRGTEASLFAQLGTAKDPVALSERLAETVTRRISEESRLRDDLNQTTLEGLKEQLSAAEKLKDVVAGIPQFVGELRVGDLSPLSRRQQLNEAQALFESTVVRARGGDATAIGNLQQNARLLIDEAVKAYGSGPQAAAIFNKVVTTLEEFATNMSGDARANEIQRQIDALENIDETGDEMLQALLSIDRALGGRYSGSSTGGVADVLSEGPNAANTAADLSSQNATANALGDSVPAALLTSQLREVVTNTAKLDLVVSGIGQQQNIDRAGYTQVVERQRALEGLMERLLTGLNLGPALVP